MADDGSVGRSIEVAELLFLRPGRSWLRAVIAAPIVVACCVLGALSLNIQGHFAAEADPGRFGTLLARGSTAATAWIGWAAAVFFAVAVWRLRRGAPEPPAGRAPVESLTPAQLRSGLVREYTLVRIAFTVLAAMTLTDTARTARYVLAGLAGDSLARASTPAVVIEALGLVAAAAALTLWVIGFRRQLVRIGAIQA